MVLSALFVCLGNICRSPIAEAVFSAVLKERFIEEDWEVDSAALAAFHVGHPPDSRAAKTLKKHKVPYGSIARVIDDEDFRNFDYIFGMDENNIANLKHIRPKHAKAKIFLLGEFDPEGDKIIKDPYYDTGLKGFEKCYQQCVRSCNGFLDQLEQGKLPK